MVGLYEVSAYRLGEPAGLGFWAGGSLELIENRFQLEGEFVSGRHAYGAIVAGPRFFFTENIPVGAGFSAPNPGQTERIYGALLQLEVDGLLRPDP